ncbi:MAG TPA: leucyl aminopeptidase family protein [Baekduia sp.]|uniref:M17 family metallopeptidase n=1 Tax=Baekduia sp. TaxID=2600305 RepID=UPI002CAEF512|nr:leucyl aminopeptidase family protein [Baekduia sp.]HMJ36293.1 leucyl aminopeptidase family protein [Baekduia sp.]
MHVAVAAADPYAVGADLVAAAVGPRASQLGAPPRAVADADPVAIVYGNPTDPAPLAVVALEPDVDGLRTAAARAVRACRGGGTVAWALDTSLPLPVAEQVRALAEGAVVGGYEARRWRSGERPRGVERFVICGCDDDLAPVADRAALVARWTNVARELVDAPPNVISPAGLAERATAFPGLRAETVDPGEAGLGALAAVGASSPARPLLLVLRHEPRDAPDAPRLALVGKAVTFDTGGYFLKPQADIVRQKADMAGGAAVVAALGAIAELGLPLSVTGVVPACENMLSGSAIRPTDVVRTAAGLTVEVTNPDAEGRLILADALWYARRDGATHLVDLATLTGALRAGMGDLYAGVFAADESWRDAVVEAGNASGDLAWPWPLHPRYRPLIDSTVADLRNTAGKSFGFPIVAATFLQQFAGDGPWAHVDMLGPALVDDDRGDAFGPGATGYGVRMLIELATRLSTAAGA